MSNNSYYNDQWRIINEPNQNKVSNYSMEFDGTSDFIDCGDSDKFSFGDGTTDRPFSLSGWVKPNDLTKFRFINKWSGSLGYEYQFSTGTNDTLSFIINSLGTTSRIGIITSTLTSTDWQHWVATYDGTGSTTGTNSGMKIYINGVEVTTSDLNSGTYVAMQNTAAPLKIGTEDKNNYYANGKIDQVTIFDYELPATGTNSVATLYGGGTAITNPMSLSPKPIAYYQLGDQSVSTGPTSDYLVPNNSLSDFVFNFDATNDYINAGSASYLNGLSQFSISVWFNLHTAADAKCIISDWNYNTSPFGHFSLRTTDTSGTDYALILYIKKDLSDAGSNAVKTSVIFTENTWHNVVFTYNSGTITYYVNGSSVSSTTIGTIASSLLNQDGILTIGNWPGLSQYWDGELSNISVFNTSLSTANIETIYNNGSPNDISSLSPIAWYKLNAADTFDGSNWTINDYGSGGNDGTSSGMTSANLVVSDLQQTSGYSPYALDFDGVDDYLNCGNDSSLQITGAMTISYWIKGACTNGASGVSTFDSVNSPGYILGPHSNRLVTFIIADAGSSGSTKKVDSTQQITTTEWHHIVGCTHLVYQ